MKRRNILKIAGIACDKCVIVNNCGSGDNCVRGFKLNGFAKLNCLPRNVFAEAYDISNAK